MNGINYPGYVPHHFQNLSTSFLIHNLHIPQIVCKRYPSFCVITGPPTHSVGDSIALLACCGRLSSSVVLRPVRATPCSANKRTKLYSANRRR